MKLFKKYKTALRIFNNIYLNVIFVLIIGSSLLQSQSNQKFPEFVSSLQNLTSLQRTAKVDSFITAQTIKGFPVIESTAVYFIYRGSVSSSIVLTGDHTNWTLPGNLMQKVFDTDLHFVKKEFELDARIDYKFVIGNGGSWILDPLNSKTIMGGFGPNSELAMPNYIQPKEIIYNPNIAHGTVTNFTIASSYLNNSRVVKVYNPGSTNPNYEFPTIYVHDGIDYINIGSMVNVLDNLIAEKKIDPLICVFVPPIDRSNEYLQSKIIDYSNFVTKELIPFIDSNFKTIKSASRRGVMGASNGGHISLYLAINYPELFGFVAGQSSTITSQLINPIQNNPRKNTFFYLDCGTYDINSSSFNFLELNRNFFNLLKSKSYNVKYFEYHEGHSWGNWRAHLDDILKSFQTVTSTPKVKPASPSRGNIEVLPNYPNPFNPLTNISFLLNKKEYITLTLSDILGRNIKTISEGFFEAGKHTINFAANEIKSGSYFYTFQTSNQSITKKMIVIK